ncbi:hypothetical protein ACEPPN_010059 [Leptodophora sp. 'Broadleaf-Isolate-01']
MENIPNYAPSCQTARAADYYGLGVRLGIYFTWLQTYIANALLSSEISGAADTNTIFLLVLLIAMIKCSSSHMLEQIDGLILMHLSGGFVFGTFSIWGYRTRHYVENGPKAIRFFGGFGTHSRLIVSLAVSIYGLWYWLYAVTGGLVATGSAEEIGDLTVSPPNSPECAILFTFMFGKVRADGGIRTFYIVVCTACIFYFGTMLLASTVAGWARMNKMVKLYRQQRWADTTRLRFATGLKYRELEIIFKTFRILNFLWLIYSALLIEFSLNFNNATAVLRGRDNGNELHLPAQLLPLLIGTFGLVRVLYLVVRSKRSPEDTEPSLLDTYSPKRSRTLKVRNLLLAFSPAMSRDSTITKYDPDEVDELERGRPWHVRYLVAWLPWLSILKYFKDNPKVMKGERLSYRSYQSGLSQEYQMVDLAQPPKLGERKHENADQ